MITYCSTLYAGHVLEGDGIGCDGQPANDRWYSNERCAYAFEIAKETAQSLEDFGYDILWMAEHHFQREGYECIPNLLMLGFARCHIQSHLWLKTRSVYFRTGVPLVLAMFAVARGATGVYHSFPPALGRG